MHADPIVVREGEALAQKLKAPEGRADAHCRGESRGQERVMLWGFQRQRGTTGLLWIRTRRGFFPRPIGLLLWAAGLPCPPKTCFGFCIARSTASTANTVPTEIGFLSEPSSSEGGKEREVEGPGKDRQGRRPALRLKSSETAESPGFAPKGYHDRCRCSRERSQLLALLKKGLCGAKKPSMWRLSGGEPVRNHTLCAP
jgi:hypothetical protein